MIGHRRLAAGAATPLAHSSGVVALDGEREVVLTPGEPMSVRFSQNGPRVVDLGRTLEEAARRGILRGGEFE